MLYTLLKQAYAPVYSVKLLTEADSGEILTVYQSNTAYYRILQNHPATAENCREDLEGLPAGLPEKNKCFAGLYQKNRLVSVLDLLNGYPQPDTLYIGLFMLDAAYQGCHTGTEQIKALLQAAEKAGFLRVELGCLEKNESGLTFWRKLGFQAHGDVITDINGKLHKIIKFVYKLPNKRRI